MTKGKSNQAVPAGEAAANSKGAHTGTPLPSAAKRQRGLDKIKPTPDLANEPILEIEALAARRGQRGPQRSRAWEREHKVTLAVRGIPESTRSHLTDLANQLGLPLGELVRFCLEYTLTEVADGRLDLAARVSPRTIGATLFPAGGAARE